MAKKDKIAEDAVVSNIDEVAADLIKSINKEFGHRIAYNLAVDEAPTIVKRWIDTGSRQLNYLIRNAADGGYPEGRIIEISGMPSTGKSHLAYAAARSTQQMGGLVVYIDTENATSIQLLQDMGLDTSKRFVYVETSCTEEVFSIVESTITKAKAVLHKNIPILVIWDSVAATSPRAELDGEYEQNTVGLQARVISKGMRKITGVIANLGVTFLCLNQLREGIGVMHGDPLVTPGGKAIPFHASVRVRLGSGNIVKDDKTGLVIGTHVTINIKKNKVAPPARKCEFDIIFGRGIVENEYIFDTVRLSCKDLGPLLFEGMNVLIEGDGAWKTLQVTDPQTNTVKLEKKFQKSTIDAVFNDPKYKKYVDALIDRAYSSTKLEHAPLSLDEDEVTVDE